jgi:hypothetical protein
MNNDRIYIYIGGKIKNLTIRSFHGPCKTIRFLFIIYQTIMKLIRWHKLGNAHWQQVIVGSLQWYSRNNVEKWRGIQSPQTPFLSIRNRDHFLQKLMESEEYKRRWVDFSFLWRSTDTGLRALHARSSMNQMIHGPKLVCDASFLKKKWWVILASLASVTSRPNHSPPTKDCKLEILTVIKCLLDAEFDALVGSV